jgi:hypothetical protein
LAAQARKQRKEETEIVSLKRGSYYVTDLRAARERRIMMPIRVFAGAVRAGQMRILPVIVLTADSEYY